MTAKLKIAIQKDGRLREESLALLRSFGLEFERDSGRAIVISCSNAAVDILNVRHRDIPLYISWGVADLGLVGQNVLYEHPAPIPIIRQLGFGQCKLIIAVPESSNIKTLADLEGKRIATSYPISIKRFLDNKKISATTVEIRGSVEAAPELGLADAICDLTQTGSTLRAHRLRILATIMESEAVLIGSITEVELINTINAAKAFAI